MHPQSNPQREALLPAESVEFRLRVIDGMGRAGPHFYIDRDTLAGACPLCDAVLSVYFAGRAPQAEFVCGNGCSERAIAAALGRLAPRAAA
jgi:hypothetical protein